MIKNKFFNALTIALILFQAVLPINALAMTSTDLQDYGPGSVVTISGDNSDGAGFQAGETVHVDVTDPDGAAVLACDAVADENGAWSCQVTLAADAAGGTYSYSAVGETSSAAQSGGFTVTVPTPPTPEPTQPPTAEPTAEPTLEPTAEPTQPTVEPTSQPTQEPTAQPTQEPTSAPTSEPTVAPTPTAVVYPSAPFITSDKDDYAPGELVTLTSGYWQPGESVHMIVNDTLGDSWRLSTDVVADSNGAFVYRFNLPNWFVAQYHVYTYGVVSGAATTDFTDSVTSVTITAPTNGSPVTITSLPATVTFSFNYVTSTGTTTGTADIVGSGLSNSKSLTPGSGSDNIVVTVPVGTANGTYNAKVTVSNSTGSGATNKNDNQNGAIIINVPTCTVPSITTNPSNQTVTYGSNATFTAAANGSPVPTVQWQVKIGAGSFTNLTNVAPYSGVTTGTLTITSPSVSLSTNQYRAVFTNTCGGTQTATSTAATLTVSQRAVTITADAKSKGYGDADPALTYQVTSGSLVTGDSFSGSLTRVAGENFGTYAIQQGTVALNSNYALFYVGANLTIGKRAVTITADAKSKTYGNADPALTYQITSGSLVTGDSFSGSLTRVAGENFGTYAIQQGTVALSTNYTLSYVGADLTIGTRPVTITADAKSKTYGDDNPALTATVTGTVNGDTLNYTLATSALKFSSVGGYPITVTLGSNPNYDVTAVNGTLSIGQKAATVTANDKSKTYGDVNPTFDATVLGTVNGDTLNYSLATSATQFSNVGDYAIVVTLGSNPNYDVTAVDGTLSIGQKAATVTANDKSKTYGDLNPTFDATVLGTVNGDTLNYSLATTATQFSNVGDYAIVVTLGSNPNYDVTSTNGNLHINQKTASVTANNKSKTYGDANPALNATVVGEVAGGDAINYSLSTSATQFSNVGDYAIVVTLGLNPNYNVTPTNGNLHINQKAASVTPNAASKVYGSADPALTGSLSGFLPADGVTATYSRAAGETVGTYTISATLSSVGVLSNYSITYNTANFTITKKAASVTPNAASKSFGASDPAFTGTLSGFLPADGVTATYSRTAGEAVGSYTISATLSPAGVLGNYNITYNTATFTINAWTKNGFFQPVDMGSVWNTVKSGSTVPLKFELFSGTTELTDVSAVKSILSKVVACTALPGAAEDAIETLGTTGGTALRYDSTGGQFIFNWKTSGSANTCLQVTMTAADNVTTITAFFKLK